MATLKIKHLHGNVQSTIDYILNPDKVEDFLTSTTSTIDTSIVGLQWRSKQSNLKKNKITGFHMIMSFPPDTVSPEECYEAAEEYMKQAFNGEYDHCIAVHTDKTHIHAHIVVNSISNITGKTLRMNYKKDLPKLKEISDRVCEQMGLPFLEETKDYEAKHYYSWLNNRLSDREILMKTIDAILPRISNVEDLFNYLQAVGYDVKGDIKGKNDLAFTIHQKLFRKVDENTFAFRVPYTKSIVTVDRNDVVISTTKKGIQIAEFSIKDPNKVIQLEDENGTRKISFDYLKGLVEDKTQKNNRQISVKLPKGKRYLRLNRLKDENYSLEGLKKRITNKKTDVEILNRIKEYQNGEQKVQDDITKAFLKDNKISFRYSESEYANMTGYQKYALYMQENLQRRFNRISLIYQSPDLEKKLKELSIEEEQIKKDFSKISKELNHVDAILKRMMKDVAIGMLEMNQEEMAIWAKTHREPLVQQKRTITDKLGEIKKGCKEIEKKLQEVYGKTTLEKKKEELDI
ncbi:relaxase/mobilization nuclease domain-containing protein [Bulleidia sp. zg-1006]|uniref:relaxase/mobilization nuclease domain-containing protein n=1 Tax=Bulleidia sp. zg-1006 TaxID=2806552 RepID=UPI001939CD35|nr:relaxase/mobilization nuclease domain-containing protein [Bulleidia sp. zg-1006]QRG86077.1 relaxase/mobilization nuclease domain-containing protein [Bulleidia sp. zg-1006]